MPEFSLPREEDVDQFQKFPRSEIRSGTLAPMLDDPHTLRVNNQLALVQFKDSWQPSTDVSITKVPNMVKAFQKQTHSHAHVRDMPVGMTASSLETPASSAAASSLYSIASQRAWLCSSGGSLPRWVCVGVCVCVCVCGCVREWVGV